MNKLLSTEYIYVCVGGNRERALGHDPLLSTFLGLDHALEGSHLPQGFLHPKASHVSERKYYFLELFRLLHYQSFSYKCNFEGNFSAKIELNRNE